MKVFKQFLLAAALAAAGGAPAIAQQPQGVQGAAATVPAASAASEMTDAEVRKVDKDQKKITLKHGEIKSMDMPPMTMVFGVKDAALLDQVKAGDKVRFKAVDEGGGKLTVVEMQSVQ
jgi:Cu/Ag efflux protein CusF